MSKKLGFPGSKYFMDKLKWNYDIDDIQLSELVLLITCFSNELAASYTGAVYEHLTLNRLMA